MLYDCIIVGGGIAGLQGAIQLGRYQHSILVIDAQAGRSSICRSYHNLLGWPEGISGEELRAIGKKQAENLGTRFIYDEVTSAEKTEKGFLLQTKGGEAYEGARLLLTTGVKDRIPPKFQELLPCFGLSVYICPDCDGYEIRNKATLVIGAGNSGAAMALTLRYWTDKIIYVNHEQNEVSPDYLEKISTHGIEYCCEPVQDFFFSGKGKLTGIELKDGRHILTEGTFIAFGGNEVKSGLAAQLGVEKLENHHVLVDPRTKMTNIKNVWAAGDVVAHSEQVTIAMGEAAQAAIWIHKSLVQGL